jgi:hypothetical protein
MRLSLCIMDGCYRIFRFNTRSYSLKTYHGSPQVLSTEYVPTERGANLLRRSSKSASVRMLAECLALRPQGGGSS